ncbi:MAG: hypothetical protein L0191_14405, partial [Acidobacteria bacterium]|nr:hypothetical protein [Acidobacteriota bacterium]
MIGPHQTLALLALLASQVQPERELDRFLEKYIGFTDADLKAMDQGRAVVKMLETGLDREIAVFGAVWIEASPSLYLEKCKDIESFEKGSGFLYTKKIGEPPRPEDFANLRLNDQDIKALRNCKVGDCEIKLGAELLERVKKEIDWSAPDYRQRVDALTREAALDYVQAYQRGGNEELAVYRDKERPTYIAEEFRSMVEKSDFLPVYLPELHQYLLDYPSGQL